MTMRSAPAGNGAPVKMRTHVPGSSFPPQPRPGRDSPTIRSDAGYEHRSALRTAYPSIAETSARGESIDAITGSASTRPTAAPSAMVSVPSGIAVEPMIAIASSKLIMVPLFPTTHLTSTTPKRAAAAAARTSQLSEEAYPWRGKGGEWDGLVYWPNRGVGGSDRRTAQGARETARA